ncbi:type II toxin-antitoxin system Phd/YefM family antitoxin [Streptomyces sp. DG2A-72]|uniref:type II toxin-antitoxin system Phd/YefM family antitoxin n=1 Tax=Streptomyces sp. DG2A-72 TaxID=3051386 RepID=UPI00265C351A|nr:type II toxin-antitoxin system Phd/YefM family antitoxin [Streptomyces sp. DG2A-72]MDO0932013.1 type II toxin-antitoxin system Phd/YefM family antitoxin [Streptomyces sp. DG2A-72]
MSAVSVREFSYNPSAVFARVEKGETVEVTRHGNVIAIVTPAESPMQRYAHLVAEGKIRLPEYTAADRHGMPRYDVPDDVDPLATLLAEREEDYR